MPKPAKDILSANGIVCSKEEINDELYCSICTTNEISDDWKAHVENPQHAGALRQFKLIFFENGERVSCRACGTTIDWEEVRSHANWHKIVPWYEIQDKYKIFFENRVSQVDGSFDCFPCEIKFSEWSEAFFHISEDEHQKLIAYEPPIHESFAPDGTSYESLVTEGFEPWGAATVKCRLCNCPNVTLKNLDRHTDGLDHRNAKQNFRSNFKPRKNNQLEPTKNCENSQAPSIERNPSGNSRIIDDCRNQSRVSSRGTSPANFRSFSRPEMNKKCPPGYLTRLFNGNNVRQNSSNFPVEQRPDDRYCTICEISVKTSVDAHLAEERHSSNLRRYGHEQITPIDDYRYRCKLCKCEVPNLENVYRHIKGQRHRNILLELKKKKSVKEEKNRSSGSEEIIVNRENSPTVKSQSYDFIVKIGATDFCCKICLLLLFDQTKIDDHVAGISHNYSLNVYGNAKSNDYENYYCKTCQCVIPNFANVPLHANGTRHKYLLNISNKIPTDLLRKNYHENRRAMARDYITITSDTDYYCIICNIPFKNLESVNDHVKAKIHSTALEKYGCWNISTMGGNKYDCGWCDCVIPDFDNIYVHISGKRHLENVSRKNRMKNTPEDEKITKERKSRETNLGEHRNSSSKTTSEQISRSDDPVEKKMEDCKPVCRPDEKILKEPEVSKVLPSEHKNSCLKTTSEKISRSDDPVEKKTEDCKPSSRRPDEKILQEPEVSKVLPSEHKNSCLKTTSEQISRSDDPVEKKTEDCKPSSRRPDEKILQEPEVSKVLPSEHKNSCLKTTSEQISRSDDPVEKKMEDCKPANGHPDEKSAEHSIETIKTEDEIDGTKKSFSTLNNESLATINPEKPQSSGSSEPNYREIGKPGRKCRAPRITGIPDDDYFYNMRDKLTEIERFTTMCLFNDVIYCIICRTEIPSGLDNFYEHFWSLEHCENLEGMEKDHELFEFVPGQFSELDLASRHMEETSEETVRCHVCQTDVKNNNYALNDHVTNVTHETNDREMLSRAEKVFQNIEPRVRCDWYKIHSYQCVPCSLDFPHERNFTDHLRSTGHRRAVKKLEIDGNSLIYNFCEKCGLLWYGFRATYAKHCETESHKSIPATSQSDEESEISRKDSAEGFVLLRVEIFDEESVKKRRERMENFIRNIETGLSVENANLIKFFDDMMLSSCQKLLLLLEEWLTVCELSGSEQVTTYALYWYVIFFLQGESMLPGVVAVDAKKDGSPTITDWKIPMSNDFKSNSNVKELLVKFFTFYANFDYQHDVACPLLGRVLKKRDFADPRNLPEEIKPPVDFIDNSKDPEYFRFDSAMCIQDPFDLGKNLTKSISKVDLSRFRRYCFRSLRAFKIVD